MLTTRRAPSARRRCTPPSRRRPGARETARCSRRGRLTSGRRRRPGESVSLISASALMGSGVGGASAATPMVFDSGAALPQLALRIRARRRDAGVTSDESRPQANAAAQDSATLRRPARGRPPSRRSAARHRNQGNIRTARRSSATSSKTSPPAKSTSMVHVASRVGGEIVCSCTRSPVRADSAVELVHAGPPRFTRDDRRRDVRRDARSRSPGPRSRTSRSTPGSRRGPTRPEPNDDHRHTRPPSRARRFIDRPPCPRTSCAR